MTKDEYIDIISRENLNAAVTTDMMSRELHSIAVAKVLMDKGIITWKELNNAFQWVNREFAKRMLDGCDESEFSDL